MRQRQAIRVGRQFVHHVMPAIVKPAHALWHEVIGFIFLCLGGTFGFWSMRVWIAIERGRGAPGNPVRLFFAGIATILMLWYGIDGFRRARKISRS